MGYLLNDNRESGGGRFEADTRACPHCQAVIVMSAWRKNGGYCFNCNALVCHACFQAMQEHGCTPFARLVELALGGKPALTYEDVARQTKFVVPRPAIRFFDFNSSERM
jgi:hypothetical protein